MPWALAGHLPKLAAPLGHHVTWCEGMDLGSLSLPSHRVQPPSQMAFLQSDGTQGWAPR